MGNRVQDSCAYFHLGPLTICSPPDGIKPSSLRAVPYDLFEFPDVFRSLRADRGSRINHVSSGHHNCKSMSRRTVGGQTQIPKPFDVRNTGSRGPAAPERRWPHFSIMISFILVASLCRAQASRADDAESCCARQSTVEHDGALAGVGQSVTMWLPIYLQPADDRIDFRRSFYALGATHR